ncbi:MAG: SLC13 family permease [Planctomycetota bacterium]
MGRPEQQQPVVNQEGEAAEGETDSFEEPNLTASAGITLGVVVCIVVMFALEPAPLFLLALGVPVLLAALEPWTGLGPSEAISGFAAEATITILAMYILTVGVRRTGMVQILGDKISEVAGSSITRQVAIITGFSGPTAGLINNTPVVAILIPMVANLARRMKTSASKLMIPLSYAAMLGGTLTLVGSSTNLLASDISARLIGRSFSFFEFTGVGIIILLTGIVYLVTVGHRLLPERIKPEEDLAEEYGMNDFLTEVMVDQNSDYIGENVEDVFGELDFELDLVQIVRDGEQFMEPHEGKTLRIGDRLIIRASRENLLKLIETRGVKIFSGERVSEKQLEEPGKGQVVLQVAVPSGSFLENETLEAVNFQERYPGTVLAIRRGRELSHTGLEDARMKAGDVLLLLASENTAKRLRANDNFVVAEEIDPTEYRRAKTPIVLGIMAGVVLFAALNITSIVISALGGALLMCALGCVNPKEVPRAVDWEVIFLLAGLIPLGKAMENSGAADYLAANTLQLARHLPPLGTLALFYFVTALLTNLIHKNASVVLMIPVAVQAAGGLGLDPFPFLVTVMLAGSTAFLTPVGNQTNLMVYGPGSYRFRDFIVAGFPLQLLLTVVTPLAVNWFWPLAAV